MGKDGTPTASTINGNTDELVVDSRRRTSMVDGDKVVVEDSIAALIRGEEGGEVGVALPERRPCRRALLILSQCSTLSSAQPNFVNYLCDNAYGNYTTNSTYQQNLNTLFSNVSSYTQITYGFYNFSYGDDPNIVRGIALCRGDVLLVGSWVVGRGSWVVGPSLPYPLCVYCDNTYGNYTTNSTYRQNLNTLLTNMYSDTKITSGFYNFSYGKDPDMVYGLALFQGDVALSDCRRCMKLASTKLLAMCSYQKQAIRWYNACMLRYTNRTMFGVMDTLPLYTLGNET
ncbi:hypothetical protein V2J09_002719 [Rumex salicifolius]